MNLYVLPVRRCVNKLSSYLFHVILLLNLFGIGNAQDYCYISPSDQCLQIQRCGGSYREINAVKYSYSGGCKAIGVEIRHSQRMVSPGTIPYCKMGETPSSECQRSCGDPPTYVLGCNGVASYCANHTCSPSYQCFCSMVNISSYDEIKVNGVWAEVTGSDAIVLGVFGETVGGANRKLLSETRDMILGKRDYAPALGALQLLRVSIHNGDLIIDIPISPGYLVIRKLSTDLVTTVNITSGGQFTYLMSDKDRSISGDVTSDFFYGGALYASGGTFYNGNHFCRLYDCYTCGEAWSTVRCIPTRILIMMYLFYAIMGLFILLLIPLACCGVDFVILMIVFPLRVMTNCCMPGKTPFAKIWRPLWDGVKVYTKRPENVAVKKMGNEGLYEEEKQNLIETEEGKSGIVKRVKVGNKWYVVGLLMLLPLILGDCSSSSFITATFNDCTTLPNGDQTCNITTAIETNLLTTGASTCFLVKNGNTTESIQIEVKHSGVIATYDLEILYYTSSWTGGSQSAHRCWQAGNCVQGRCESLEGSGNPLDAYGELPATYLNTQPGRTGCRRSCGGGCTGCFFTDPGCVFYRYGILPNGPVFSVARPINLKVAPYVTINVSTPNSTFVRMLQVGNPIFDTQMRAFVVGLYNQPVETFSGRYILRNTVGLSTKVVTASPLNQPQVSSIGDIQASTAAALVSANANAFAFAPNLMTATQGATSQSYSWAQAGLNLLTSFPDLPSVFGGSIWTLVSSQIVANLTSPSAITVGVELLGGLRVTRFRNIVCPVATYVTVGGCYACSNGSALVVRMASTCKAGPVSVSISNKNGAQSLLTTFVSITTSMTEYPIYFSSDVQVNTLDFVFSAEGGNATVHAEFSAWPGPNVTLNNTPGYSGNTSSGPGSGWNFGWIGETWDKFIKGTLSTLGYILMIGGIIIAIIVGVVGLVLGGIAFFFLAKWGLGLLGELAAVSTLYKNLFGKSDAVKMAEKIK